MDTNERKVAVEAEARRLGYSVAWRGNEMIVTRTADGHSGCFIVGAARCVVGSLQCDDRQLRMDADRIAYAGEQLTKGRDN